MRILTTILSLLLCCGAAHGQSKTKPKTPPDNTAGATGNAGQSVDESGAAGGPVPDAIGLQRAGLLGKDGRPVSPAAAAKIRELMKGGAAGQFSDPTVDKDGNKIIPNGAHLFTPTAHLRPRRLAPGESGKLSVLVQLRRDNVVPGGATARLELAADNGPLILGVPELMAPGKGTPNTKFAGQPVYEGTMVFLAPVTIREDAKPGMYQVRGTVHAEISDSKTGRKYGLFRTEVQGKVRVGPSLTPKAKNAPRVPRQAGPADTVPDTTARARPPERKDAVAPRVDAPESASAQPGQSAPPAANVTPSPVPAAAPPTGISFVLLAGLGLAVVLILLLLVRRR